MFTVTVSENLAQYSFAEWVIKKQFFKVIFMITVVHSFSSFGNIFKFSDIQIHK